MTNYFRIDADRNARDRWFLGSPINARGEECDPRVFVEGKVQLIGGGLTLPLRRNGRPVDFNLGDFDMPVLGADIIDKLTNLVDLRVQRIPVGIAESMSRFDILNVLDVVECIDDVKSVYTRWHENDGRPEKTGQYRMIVDLRIDPERARGHHLFRPKEWDVALIVSDRMKNALEELEVTGLEYQLVS